MTAIHAMTATELAAQLSSGELTSVQIVEALHARTDAVDARVRAMVVQLRQEALRDAAARDEERRAGKVRGPLHGLPVTIKENIEVVGTEATAGLRARSGKRSEHDAITVCLAREAGLVILGKTNVPQTLIAAETTNRMYGTTNNPWNTARVPGGSSGGEAAALATGQSVLGIGTDIGGSARNPAAFCGVVGVKPTLHRWSNWGSTGAIPGQEFVRSQIGPMARTTRDVALLLRTLDSPLHAKHDPECPPLPIGDPAAIDLRKICIGYYEDDGFVQPSAALRRAVREAVEHLRAAGAEVVPYEPPNAADHYYTYVAALSSDGLRTLRRELDGEETIQPLKLMERLAALPDVARRAAAGVMRWRGESRVARLLDSLGEKTVTDLWSLTWRRLGMQREERVAWDRAGIHALICPPFATPAPQHESTGDFSAGATYTLRYNLLNLPAGIVPVTRVRPDEQTRAGPRDRIDHRAASIDAGSAGLPASVQVVARAWREDVMLAVMQAIEDRARPSPEFPTTPIDPR